MFLLFLLFCLVRGGMTDLMFGAAKLPFKAAAFGMTAPFKAASLTYKAAKFAAQFNEVPEESSWSNHGSVQSRVVRSSNGGGLIGDAPVIENEIRFRGTTPDGRELTAADFLDAEMSGKFSGKGNVMEAATGENEVLSPDKSRRDITGVKIEGLGPSVMNVRQKVLVKTKDYAKVEFSMDGEGQFAGGAAALNGKFYEEYRRLPNGEISMREVWNKDADSQIRSSIPLGPGFIAKVHSQGTLGQARNLANRIGLGQNGYKPMSKAEVELLAEKAKCSGDDSAPPTTGRSLLALRRNGASCSIVRVRALQAQIAFQKIGKTKKRALQAKGSIARQRKQFQKKQTRPKGVKEQKKKAASKRANQKSKPKPRYLPQRYSRRFDSKRKNQK